MEVDQQDDGNVREQQRVVPGQKRSASYAVVGNERLAYDVEMFRVRKIKGAYTTVLRIEDDEGGGGGDVQECLMIFKRIHSCKEQTPGGALAVSC